MPRITRPQVYRALTYLVVQGEFGHRPLEPAVLGLQLLQTPRLVDAEAAVLGPPAEEGLLRDTDAADGRNDRAAAGNDDLRLSEVVDDFLRLVFSLWHVSSPDLSRILTSILERFQEVRSRAVSGASWLTGAEDR